MANIKDFIKKIGNSAVSLEEQQQALAQVEQTIIEAKQKRTEAVGKNADMVIQALKTIEARLEAKLVELNNTPAKQGIQGPAGQDGKDGKDGQNGRDGLNGKNGTDGKDGIDGQDGVSVVDAKIDFDGSLVIYLSNGNEIDCGQILQPEVAKNIIISSGGSGTSQVVTDTLVSLQSQITSLSASAVTVSGTQTLTNKTLTDPALIGTILEDVFTITDGAAFEIDPANGSIQIIVLGASRTPKGTNFLAGEAITMLIDDGAAYTITWTDSTFGTGGITWVGGTAPTLSTSGYTVIELWKVGTKVYGASIGGVA